jgi:hypothetical protein
MGVRHSPYRIASLKIDCPLPLAYCLLADAYSSARILQQLFNFIDHFALLRSLLLKPALPVA